MARLGAEPGVEAVTFSSFVPGFAGGARIQFADASTVTAPAPWDVSRLDVAPDMLDVYGAEMLAGRRFTPGDAGAANAVIVNQTFAQWLSGDGNALGVRFRYLEQARAIGGRRVVRDRRRRPRLSALSAGIQLRHAGGRLSRGPVGTVNPAVLSVRFNGAVPAGFSVRPAKSRPRSTRPCRCAGHSRSRRTTISCARSGATSRGASALRDAERAAPLRRRDVRLDVVHGRATDARDRHPRRAWRPPAAPARQRLRHASFVRSRLGIVLGSLASGLAMSIAELNPARRDRPPARRRNDHARRRSARGVRPRAAEPEHSRGRRLADGSVARAR